MSHDRMFHVLVLGGVALLGACGTSGRVFTRTDAGAEAGPADGATDGDNPDVLLGLGFDAGDAFWGLPPPDAGSDQDAGFPVEAP